MAGRYLREEQPGGLGARGEGIELGGHLGHELGDHFGGVGRSATRRSLAICCEDIVVAWWNISSRSAPNLVRCIPPLLAADFVTATPFSTSVASVPYVSDQHTLTDSPVVKMSFQSLQERLAALQETTSQLKELIDRLADLKFQPGSVPLDASEEGSVSGELSTEIGNLLRDGDDERELLLEEVEYLRHEDKARLRDGVERQGQELDRSVAGFPLLCADS